MATQNNSTGASHPKANSRCRVLVLGDLSVGSYIRRELERRGCDCLLAASSDEAADLANRNDFSLVISTIPLEDEHPFLSQLCGTQCTVLVHQPSGGFLCWLPVMSRGTKYRAPALSAIELIDLVDRTLAERKPAAAA